VFPGRDTLEFIGSWGGLGTADGQLNYPNAMAAQHGIWIENCGSGCTVSHPLANLNDILVTETWGPTTGVRRFSIGIEGFDDSVKYIAKTNSGGGNFVDYFYRLTDYASVTEKVYSSTGALVATLASNAEHTPGPNNFDFPYRWFVGTNGSGTYRIEITANSLYGGLADTFNFSVVVDTALRNNAPSIADPPIYRATEICFFPSNASTNQFGGSWVKTGATDPDPDLLTYHWSADYGNFSTSPEFMLLNPWPTIVDSVFFSPMYTGPAPSGPAPPPFGPECSNDCIHLYVSDPAGNSSLTDNLSIKKVCRRGDMDANGAYTAVDVVKHTSAAFLGEPPGPYGDFAAVGDMNCDAVLNSQDVVLLINFVFLGTIPPC
jgi:hypothetical protein